MGFEGRLPTGSLAGWLARSLARSIGRSISFLNSPRFFLDRWRRGRSARESRSVTGQLLARATINGLPSAMREITRQCEAIRRRSSGEGGALSLSLFSSCRTSHPSHRPHQLRRSLTLSRPRVAAVGVASKLGQSLVAVASRFGDSKEGRKEGRKEERKEGRKEGRKRGRVVSLSLPLLPSIRLLLFLPILLSQPFTPSSSFAFLLLLLRRRVQSFFGSNESRVLASFLPDHESDASLSYRPKIEVSRIWSVQKIFEVIGASWGVEGRRERRNREGASRNLRKLSLESEPNFVSLSRGRDKDGATVGRLASPYVPSLSLSPRRIVDRREGRFRSVSFR